MVVAEMCPECHERIKRLEMLLRMAQSELAWCQGFISAMRDGQGNRIGERKHIKEAMAVIDRTLTADLPAKIPEWALSEEAFDRFWGKPEAPYPDEDPNHVR